MASSERLAFTTEWLDTVSGVLWRYQLFFYPATGEVEMFDLKNRKHFLKRVKPSPEVRLDQMYVGSSLTLYGRLLRLVEYADDFTRNAVDGRVERTLGLVKPDAVAHAGDIVQAASGAGLRAVNLRMCQLSKAEAQQFYAVHAGQPFFDGLTSYMSSGPVVAMELVGTGGIGRWRSLLGPTDAAAARQDAPGSLRARFGSDKTRNAAHGSDAAETSAAEIDFFFGPGRGSFGRTARCADTTLAVIKPHVLKDGSGGAALQMLLDAPGLFVTALQQFTLTKPEAGEFLEVYKSVIPPGEWTAAVEELASGPCLAVEVAAGSGCGVGSPVEALRAVAGPADPELARVLRPDSLRARLGASRVRNGVHCTDLEEDGALETGYFFGILQR